MSKLDEHYYIPRFSFEISEELKHRANKLLSTHGIRKAIMTTILEDLLDIVEEHGQLAIGCILEKSVKPREALKSMSTAERICKDVKSR
jgi:hypothetical protein